jgi:glycosyl transferase, family 25
MNMLLDQFERIYVINLRSRADRRDEIEIQLKKVGLSLNSPKVVLFEAVRVNNTEGFPTLGARGCFLSHLGVLEDSVKSGLRSVLIFEDDMNFVEDFLDRSKRLDAELRNVQFNFFYGGHSFVTPPTVVGGRGWVFVEPSSQVGLSHFIGLKGDAISSAANYLKAMLARAAGDAAGGPMHVDGAYNWFRSAYPQYGTVASIPEICYQRASRTDVHDLVWFDKMPFIRDLVATIRRRRNG